MSRLHKADPHEMNNLATDSGTHGDLLMEKNDNLTGIIETEVGSDEGEFLPEKKAGWAVARFNP